MTINGQLFSANLTTRGVVRTSGTLVRAEELGIVLVVLFLWAAAIALFINRWGKIRLMEPYHPYVETQSTPQTGNAQPPANINQQVMIFVFHSQKGFQTLLDPSLLRSVSIYCTFTAGFSALGCFPK